MKLLKDGDDLDLMQAVEYINENKIGLLRTSLDKDFNFKTSD